MSRPRESATLRRAVRQGTPHLRPGVSIIDTTLSAIAAMTVPNLKVVVVSSPAKLDLVGHLARYTTLDIAVVHQRPQAGGGLGSALRSAEAFCDDAVLLCLPDQVYLSDPAPALSAGLRRAAQASIVVIATPCADPDRLRREGALLVEDDMVHAAAEKPSCAAPFNACWSSLAFDGTTLRPLADELDNGEAIPSMIGAPVVWGPEFVNINNPTDAADLTSAGGWL